MRARKFLIGVSGCALAVAGASAVSPAYAQDAGQDATTIEQEDVADEGAETSSDDDAVIIVTARRMALETAQNIKRNAETIMDAVVADDAGQLPDNSITEVLQRVSGVSISRFTGTNGGNTAFQIEGTGITVRGLPFNSSTLNGRQLFSANGASAISWNEVTPELMAAVEVYKGSTANLIEGGASLINLRTHVPFDFNKPQFNVTMGGSYGTQVKKASPRISAMYSTRFDTGIGEIGVLWDLAYSRLHQQSSNLQVGAMFAEYTPSSVRDDSLAFIPSGFNWNYSRNKRDRYGIYQALQWKPSSDLTLTNTLFFSQYVEDSLGTGAGLGRTPSASAAMMPAVGEPVEYDENGGFRKGRLVAGSTGKSVDWENTTASDSFRAANGSWFPAEYMIDCGATYGTPASTIQWDWSAGATLAQCGPAGTLNPGSGSSASHGKSSTLDISQSFVWTPSDRVALRGGLQYVDSRSTGKQMYVGISQTNQLLTSMDVDLTGSLPLLSGLDMNGILDPSTAYFSAMGYHEPDNRGKMFAGNFDLEYRVSDDSFLRTITVGARAARRTEHDNFAGTYWAPLGQSWIGNPWGDHAGDPTYGPGNILYLNNANVPAGDFTVSTFPNYFGGAVPVPAQLFVASPALLRSYDWYHLLQTYNGTSYTDENGVVHTDPTRQQRWTQYIDKGLNEVRTRITNFAAYIQAKFAHDGPIPFSGNIGVRVFHDKLRGSALLSTPNAENLALSEADSNAYFAATQGLPGATFPTLYSFEQAYFTQTRDYEYTRVLPSFNIKFDVTDKFIIRGAASIASAPPNLNDIKPGGSISARSVANSTNSQAPSILTGVQVNGGGANMKPTMITSQDLAFEFYPSSSSLIYLDLFAKQIKDQPIFYSFLAENLPIPAVAVDGDPSAPGGATETPTALDLQWLYLQNKTADKKATIKGFEVGGRKFFDKLPGLLSGFGIEGNLTYIDSSNPSQQANNVLNGGINEDGTIPQSYPNLPYAGLSKWAYNLQLLYSRGKVNVRLAYNWRDKALLSTNVNPLSYATSGGNPYWLNTSPTNFDSDHSFQVWHMVPAYTAAAGYLDFGFDYKVSEAISVSFHAGNILNTKSKTYQEPVPGVFQPYDFNVSDRRYDLSMRFKL
jgi:TonB-dependent receptor